MNVIQLIVIAFTTLILSSSSFAQETCKTESVETVAGTLEHVTCRNAEKKYTHTIQIGEQKILRDAFLAEEGNNKDRTLWLFTGKPLWETGCPDRLYLVDLSMKPVKVTAFGVKKACNEYQWASWGEKRSVIALKNNVKFTYEDGKMILPKGGEKLWKSIEPPHAGDGLKLEDAIPFSEDVPLPKQ